MIYSPRSAPTSGTLSYGGSQPDWPYGRDSTAAVFSDDGDGFWGFFDPDWVEDGKVRGQLRINIASATGRGGLGTDGQTETYWAMADEPEQIVDRIRLALKFAFEEGGRQERMKIGRSLLDA